MLATKIKHLIKNYPDYPQPGIQFKDISPVLEDADAFHSVIDLLKALVEMWEFDAVVGIDARGFVFASALAYAMGKGLIMCRKPNKLPGELLEQSYAYEYAEAALTIQKERIKPGQKYLIVDDVLATGNTGAATTNLIQAAGGEVVGLATVIDLAFLNGRQLMTDQTALTDDQIVSVMTL